MKVNKITKKTILTLFSRFFITAIVVVTFILLNSTTISVYAMVNEESFNNDEEFNDFEDIMMISGGGGRSSNVGIISGSATATLSISDLTDVNYIPNSDYFLINPRHHVNDGSDNAGGTCTTVALQMLMGYHNYYSDRRIIPATGNGRTFLNTNYGDIAMHPEFLRIPVTGQGCLSIGTEDGVYDELFDLTWISNWYGIGQAVGLVKDGGIRFMNKHTPTAVRNTISLTSGFFSKSTAQADIDAGRPIVLGMESIFSGADSFHVVPAYGYAKLDGVDGFLVHYGWGASRTQVWVPSSWFGFQIRMSVNHTHNFVDTGSNHNDTHREVQCSTCGYTKPDLLYNTTNINSNEIYIASLKYPLSGSITIPELISGKTVVQIENDVFAGQGQLTQITIPNSVTTLNDNTFHNNTSVYWVDNYAFRDNIFLESLNEQTDFTVPSVIAGKTITKISGSAFSNQIQLTQITIPSTVTSIGNDAFKNTNNASIYLEGKTNAPSTFNINWNSSNNPVYLNGHLCTHTSSTTITLDDAYHGHFCNDCRTIFSESLHNKYMSNGFEKCYECDYIKNINHSHTFTHQWIKGDLRQHRTFCSCGLSTLTGHIVSSNWNGIGYATCLECGGPAEVGFVVLDGLLKTIQRTSAIYISEYFGNGSFILSNGVIVLSDIDLEAYYAGTLVLPEVYNADSYGDHHCEDCHNECIDCDTYYYDCLANDYISKTHYIPVNKKDYIDVIVN